MSFALATQALLFHQYGHPIIRTHNNRFCYIKLKTIDLNKRTHQLHLCIKYEKASMKDRLAMGNKGKHNGMFSPQNFLEVEFVYRLCISAQRTSDVSTS